MGNLFERNLVRINTRLHNTGSEFVGKVGKLAKENQPTRKVLPYVGDNRVNYNIVR